VLCFSLHEGRIFGGLFNFTVSLVVKESDVPFKVIFFRDKQKCFYGNSPVWVVKLLYNEKCGDD